MSIPRTALASESDAAFGRDRTALIVVDMQNAYLHPQGSFARLWPDAASGTGARSGYEFDLRLLRRAIPGCCRLIDAARQASVPIVYLQYVYRPDYSDGGVLIAEINPALKDVGYVAEGTWDAEIVDELAPGPQDIVVRKARYSGFYATRLETVLRSLRVENIVLCGVTTRFCVDATGRDAHMRDYRVFLVGDATEEANELSKEMALRTFALGFGWVVSTDKVAGAWGVAA